MAPREREEREARRRALLDAGLKACTSCGRTKPLEAFAPDRRAQDGRDWHCRVCKNPGSAARALRYYRRLAVEINARTRARRAENPEPYRAHARAWRERHPERARLVSVSAHARRRANERNLPGTLTAHDVLRMWHGQRGECFYCGARFGKRPSDGAFHVEHLAPISRPELGPSNRPHAVVLACPSCNHRKQDKTPAEWRLALLRQRRRSLS